MREVALGLVRAAVLEHDAPGELCHMHAEYARLGVVLAFPALEQKHLLGAAAAEVSVPLRNHQDRIGRHIAELFRVAAAEPFRRIRRELEDRAAVLYVGTERVEKHVVRVRVADERRAEAVVLALVVARFHHHVAAHEQVVQKARILALKAAAAVVFGEKACQRLRDALVLRRVGGDDGLGEPVHEVCADALHGGLYDRRRGARLVLIPDGHVAPVVAAIETLAFVEPLPLGGVAVPVFLEERVEPVGAGLFGFLHK